MKTDKIDKEISFLYEKHNKTTKYKLEKKQIEFPENIKKILTKNNARTKREKKILDKYRKKVLYDLFLESLKLERIDDKIREEKNRIIQAKIKATRIEKMKNDPNYICHFGVWINKEKKELKISRDSYAIIDKKNHFKSNCKSRHYRMLKYMNCISSFFLYFKLPSELIIIFIVSYKIFALFNLGYNTTLH